MSATACSSRTSRGAFCGAIAALGSELTVAQPSGNRILTGGQSLRRKGEHRSSTARSATTARTLAGGVAHERQAPADPAVPVGNTAGSYGGVAPYGLDDGEPSVIENSTIAGNAALRDRQRAGSSVWLAAPATAPSSPIARDRGFQPVVQRRRRVRHGRKLARDQQHDPFAGNTQSRRRRSDLVVRSRDPRDNRRGSLPVRRSSVQAVPETGTVNGAEAGQPLVVDPKLELPA